MLSSIRSYFDSTPLQISVPSDVDSTIPFEPLPTPPHISANPYDPILQTILDALLLDTRIQSRYDLTIETSTENPNKKYLRIYPQRHVNNHDPTVYNPYVFEDPIDFFFKLTLLGACSPLTIVSNLQTCMFPSKRTLRVDVFSIEKAHTYLGLSFSNEKYPWISREPNHTQSISLDDPATVDVRAIQSYIQQTYVNIHHKILNSIPEVLDITQHYCANCKCKLQGRSV